MTEVSCEGAHYGQLSLNGESSFSMRSINDKLMFTAPLTHISQCVVPPSNRNEVEIHFQETDDRNMDSLAQITFHFPPPKEEDEETEAEQFRRSIMNSGALKASAGNIIVEFSKEQGNFIVPRGKYAIQMMPTYVHLQGLQYSYNIKYEDIHSLFLLPKLDGGRMAFVISLEKPIRQGNQKYQHLIVESHKLEQTVTVNLTEDEIREKYDGQLSPTMTMPLSSLIAKVFKVLSQTTVYIPKHFLSSREQSAIRCSLKASDGLLYPLAKSFIFIHKPTVIIKFEDIESVEFKRMDASTGTRNFDLVVRLNGNSNAAVDGREYCFSGIDKAEFGNLNDFLTVRKLNVINADVGQGKKDGLAALLAEEGQGSDESEEDEDYNAGSASGSDDGSGSDSDSDGGGHDDDGTPKKKPTKEKKVKEQGAKETATKKRAAPSEGKESAVKKAKPSSAAAKKDSFAADGKKKRAKKDKNAPKGAKTAFIFFSSASRDALKAEKPGLSIVDVAREMGVKWKAMSAEEKAPFEDQAKADKARYQAEMAAYKKAQAQQNGGSSSAVVSVDDDSASDGAASGAESVDE